MKYLVCALMLVGVLGCSEPAKPPAKNTAPAANKAPEANKAPAPAAPEAPKDAPKP